MRGERTEVVAMLRALESHQITLVEPEPEDVGELRL